MYYIGICDDGKNTCALIEEMVLLYAKKSKLRMDIQVWYTGEELCGYLEQGGLPGYSVLGYRVVPADRDRGGWLYTEQDGGQEDADHLHFRASCICTEIVQNSANGFLGQADYRTADRRFP